MISPKSAFGRAAIAIALNIGLGIAACEMPTESTVEMGKRVSLSLNSSGQATYSFQDLHGKAQATLAEIKAMPGIESINVNVMENDTGATQIELMLWGPDVPMEAIQAKLEAALAGGDLSMEVSDLSTTVQESWASKLGRDILHIEIGEGLSDEEAKAAILEQLAASGHPNARVGVQTEDGTRVIHVDNVESDGEVQTEEALIIEQQK